MFKRRADGSGGDTDLATEMAWLKAVLSHYPPGHTLRRGERCMCPKCGAQSAVILGTSTTPATTHRCASCNLTWKITERALAAHAGQAAEGARALEDAKARLASRGPLQILLIEDDPGDAKLIKSILAPATEAVVKIFHTDTLHDGILNGRLGFDAALVDVNLPDSAGMATVRRFQKELAGLPACFCTGDAEATIDLRDASVPVLPKHTWVELLQSHHQGTAEVLALILDAVESTSIGSGTAT